MMNAVIEAHFKVKNTLKNYNNNHAGHTKARSNELTMLLCSKNVPLQRSSKNVPLQRSDMTFNKHVARIRSVLQLRYSSSRFLQTNSKSVCKL
jgi:hypothetical protein